MARNQDPGLYSQWVPKPLGKKKKKQCWGTGYASVPSPTGPNQMDPMWKIISEKSLWRSAWYLSRTEARITAWTRSKSRRHRMKLSHQIRCLTYCVVIAGKHNMPSKYGTSLTLRSPRCITPQLDRKISYWNTRTQRVKTRGNQLDWISWNASWRCEVAFINPALRQRS